MREGIHPAYYQAKVVCNCGNEFVTGSTKEEIHVEICSKCHPFYTGQQLYKTSFKRSINDKIKAVNKKGVSITGNKLSELYVYSNDSQE